MQRKRGWFVISSRRETLGTESVCGGEGGELGRGEGEKDQKGKGRNEDGTPSPSPLFALQFVERPASFENQTQFLLS